MIILPCVADGVLMSIEDNFFAIIYGCVFIFGLTGFVFSADILSKLSITLISQMSMNFVD